MTLTAPTPNKLEAAVADAEHGLMQAQLTGDQYAIFCARQRRAAALRARESARRAAQSPAEREQEEDEFQASNHFATLLA